MSTLVLDHLPAELEAALLEEQGRSGRTLEEVVVDLLRSALGLKRSRELASEQQTATSLSAWAVQDGLQSPAARSALVKAFGASPQELGEAAVAQATKRSGQRG